MDAGIALQEKFWLDVGSFTSNLLEETGRRVAELGLSEQDKAVEFILAQKQIAEFTESLARQFITRAEQELGVNSREASLFAKAALQNAQLVSWFETRIINGAGVDIF